MGEKLSENKKSDEMKDDRLSSMDGNVGSKQENDRVMMGGEMVSKGNEEKNNVLNKINDDGNVVVDKGNRSLYQRFRYSLLPDKEDALIKISAESSTLALIAYEIRFGRRWYRIFKFSLIALFIIFLIIYWDDIQYLLMRKYVYQLRNASVNKDILKVIELSEKALDKDPELGEAYYYRGVAYFRLNNWADALKCFEKAINCEHVDHNHIVSSFSYAGAIYKNIKMYNESIQMLDEALKLNPEYFSTLMLKGDVYKLLNNYEESLIWFDKALQQVPDDQYCLENKLSLLDILGKYNDAILIIDKELEKEPQDYILLFSKSKMYYKLSQYDNSLNQLNIAQLIKPIDVKLFELRGDIFLKQKKYKNAIEEYEKVMFYDIQYYNANVANKMPKQK